jgi:hypothetical protein
MYVFAVGKKLREATYLYKSVKVFKQFKVITLVPTWFGSRRNHHQGERTPAQQADMPP